LNAIEWQQQASARRSSSIGENLLNIDFNMTVATYNTTYTTKQAAAACSVIAIRTACVYEGKTDGQDGQLSLSARRLCPCAALILKSGWAACCYSRLQWNNLLAVSNATEETTAEGRSA
jgi:hypothetical protein